MIVRDIECAMMKQGPVGCEVTLWEPPSRCLCGGLCGFESERAGEHR